MMYYVLTFLAGSIVGVFCMAVFVGGKNAK